MALDLGTTSVRAVLFNSKLEPFSSVQKPIKTIYPQPGWVEQDPEEIWVKARQVIKAVLKKQGIKPCQVASLGITNQRETTVVWDGKSGKVLHPAIVWQDRRTADQCERLKRDGHEPEIRRKTGLVIDPYFSGTKLQWILKKLPSRNNRNQIKFGTIDTWIIWKLTGGKIHVTDPSNASRTMMFDLRTMDWDQELVRLFGAKLDMLPDIAPSSGEVGVTDERIFGASISIGGICGDQQAALLGQGCFNKGEMKITYGTGAFLVLNTGSRRVKTKQPLITTVGWQIGKDVNYALEGSVFTCGALINWFVREGWIKDPPESEKLAESVEDTAGVYLVPALSGLGAPYWDPEAKATILGMTAGITTAHLVRAGLKGIVHQVTDVLEVMSQASGLQAKSVRVDGGVSRNDFTMQAQANLANVEVRRAENVETTVVGAAVLAGLSAKVWPNLFSVQKYLKSQARFKPKLKLVDRRSERNRWQQAVKTTQSFK